MENVEELMWGIVILDIIMMSKENWEWKLNDFWEYVIMLFFSVLKLKK